MIEVKKLLLTDEIEAQLGRNRNTVLSLWYKIAYFEQKYGYCDKSNPDFARMLGISVPTVKRCIAKLIELGLVKRVKPDFWHRKLYAIRPNQEEVTTEVVDQEEVKEVNSLNEDDLNSNDPLYAIVYNNQYNKGKYNEYHHTTKEKVVTEPLKVETPVKVEIKPIEVEILRDEFDAEIVNEALYILEQKKDKVFNPLKYTRGICLNIIKNQKSLAKKEIKKQKQLALFEEIKASRSERNDFIVPDNWYYNWMEC